MSRKTKRKLILTGRMIFAICWSVFTLIPIYTAFVTSLTKYENIGKSFLWPTDGYFQNYIDIWTRIDLLGYFKATIIYAVGTSLINVLLATFAAYALSRYRFKGKVFYSFIIFPTQVLPQVVISIPVFMILNKIHLYDTYIGVIIAILATSMAFPILLLQSFFDGIPVALEEAAAIDGCSRVGCLFRIVLPLSAPGIATTFALSFFTGWGQYLYPLILTRSADKTPLTVGIARMIDNQTPWEMVMVGTLLAIIPAIIIYLCAQRYLVQGMTAGAVK